MNLVEFKSDRGRFGTVSVHINPEDVSAVGPITEDSGYTDNRSVVILKNGERIYVKPWPDAVAKELAS